MILKSGATFWQSFYPNGATGISFKHIFASDYDRDSCHTFEKNISDVEQVICADIKSIDIKKLPYVDGFLYGFPCNDFSNVGETKGLDGSYGPLYSYGVKYIKKNKHSSIVITNSLQSSMVREADVTIPTYADKEVGVASTKAFTCQILSLANLSIEIGKMTNAISKKDYNKNLTILKLLPIKLKKLINDFTPEAKKIAKKLSQSDTCYFIGRNIVYPIALEGSLKLKEISYMHSEGFPGGEMKHGPIALIDKKSLTICLSPNNELYEKSISNAEEIAARNGKVIILSSAKTHNKSLNTHNVSLPKENFIDTPFIYTIPLQLISYYFALNEGTDIDQPRNLAKSVTVE